MSIFDFDLDDYRIPLVSPVYNWWACRVTGHAQHAANGLLAWLPFCWLIPLWVWWAIPWAFYTLREFPWQGEKADGVGDVLWVYAVGVALWLPWWATPIAGAVALGFDVWYWTSRPAPGWMPRDWTLLWGRNAVGE